MTSIGSVAISIAEAKDDEAIGRFLSRIPMDGAVRISFERRPSFLKAAMRGNREVQVVVARDHATGEIVGLGSRAVRRAFINGEPADIGYLANLRLSEKRRRSVFLSRGYQFLHDLHSDGRVKAYYSTVLEDNREALAVLTSRRAGLPVYQDLGRFNTCVLNVNSPGSRRSAGPVIVPAREADKDRVRDFLVKTGRERQFFPEPSDVLAMADAGDIFLALRGDDLVGYAALYDARAERQIVVRGYSTQFALIRRFWNSLLCPFGWPSWPVPQTSLQYAFASLLAVDRSSGSAAMFALIDGLRDKARSRGLQHLLVGFHEKDPLWPSFKANYRFIGIKSRLFLVYWDDGKELAGGLDGRPPYIELSTL